MAILMIQGVPGAGKTYEAVSEHILPAVEAGRKVITNIPLNVDRFGQLDRKFPGLLRVLYPEPSNPRPFSTLADFPTADDIDESGRGPLLVIDECQICFPKRGTLKDIQEYFQLHRKLGVDIVLVTQRVGQMDQVLVNIVETGYVLKKNTALGSRNTYRRIVKDGASRTSAEIGTPQIRTYDKRIFPLYMSHMKGGVLEQAVTRVQSIWRSWPFLGAALCAVFVVYKLVASPDDLNVLSVANSPPPAVAPTVEERERKEEPPKSSMPPQRVTSAPPPPSTPAPVESTRPEPVREIQRGLAKSLIESAPVPDDKKGEPKEEPKSRFWDRPKHISILADGVCRVQIQLGTGDKFWLGDGNSEYYDMVEEFDESNCAFKLRELKPDGSKGKLVYAGKPR